MYRNIPPEQQATILGIAQLIGEEHPYEFIPLTVEPHVSILSKRTVASQLGSRRGYDSHAAAAKLLNRIYADLKLSGDTPTKGTCTVVDFVGRNITIILDADRASNEIKFAHWALGAVLGRSFSGDGRPHVKLGHLAHPEDQLMADEILDTAASLCGVYLPEHRNLPLLPISPRKPQAVQAIPALRYPKAT